MPPKQSVAINAPAREILNFLANKHRIPQSSMLSLLICYLPKIDDETLIDMINEGRVIFSLLMLETRASYNGETNLNHLDLIDFYKIRVEEILVDKGEDD